MLQVYDPQQQSSLDEAGSGLNISRYLDILKRRLFYFIIPFVLILLVGSFLVMVQRPIYSSEGKILIESQEIPTDLVRPTVTTAANERIEVIEQRLMTRDNLMAIINKYALFPSQRKWMSATQLLDLARERSQIKLVDNTLASKNPRVVNNTIAFTVAFEYENPGLAMQVANELVTTILNEDAKNRTNRAVETSKFLAREVKRLENELGAVEAQIAEARRKPRDPNAMLATSTSAPDPSVMLLANLKTDLAQKSSLYSKNHPELKALKQRIAALEDAIAQAPEPEKPSTSSSSSGTVDAGLEPLTRQRENLERALDEATKKFSAARLGESLERDQQSERLLVIEQPTAPQKPIRPNRSKLFAMVLGLAAAAGGGALFVRESLDRSIRSRSELFSIIDSQLIVAIPYIVTKSEVRRRKTKIYMTIGVVLFLIVAGVSAVFLFGPPIDVMMASLPELDFSWLEMLTRLSK